MTRVFITTRFEGFHCWPGAAAPVEYLAQRHRHVFHVRVEKVVTHDDRDVEFIQLKNRVDRWIDDRRNSDEVANWSCETWARNLRSYTDAALVEVSEDGENGAVVTA